MPRINRWWTLVILVAALLALYALWDFVWVHLIHSDAVDAAS